MITSRSSPDSPPPVSGAPTYIFYVDRSSHKHIHYYTDDVVCHPLCESHIEGEALDTLSTLRKVEGVKAASSAYVLDGARSAAAVSAGLRVITYTTCSFTSLGALRMGTVRCLNFGCRLPQEACGGCCSHSPSG